MIMVYDAHGHQLHVHKQDWKDSVLLPKLKSCRNDPDELYHCLVSALTDGFAVDIVGAAERLAKIDHTPSRGAVILGIVYMQTDRLSDAERVLSDSLRFHGKNGVVMTNLAKVYSSQGKDAQALQLLWEALEQDPNQDNGFLWYVTEIREREGISAVTGAYRRIAALPGSWRAQVWLAREALEQKDIAAAIDFCKQAISRFPKPAPADALMQISGDLGNHGHLQEMLQVVEPVFEPSVHGLEVGNNLIKAHFDLGHHGEAQRILDQLYAQKRPDWQEHLQYWDGELAKANVAKTEGIQEQSPEFAGIVILGPIWTRDGSPYSSLLPAKDSDGPRVAFMGSTVLMNREPQTQSAQLTDTPGRISRCIPLILCEKVHLSTNGTGIALIPWIQNHGFAVFCKSQTNEDLCEAAVSMETCPDFVVRIELDITAANWRVTTDLIDVRQCKRMANVWDSVDEHDPGLGITRLCDAVVKQLSDHANLRIAPPPQWYNTASASDFNDYLLRLEQHLAVAATCYEGLVGGGIYGQREILTGITQLCCRQPANFTFRMLLARTTTYLQKTDPEILSEFADRISLLQREYPLPGNAGIMISQEISQALPTGD